MCAIVFAVTLLVHVPIRPERVSYTDSSGVGGISVNYMGTWTLTVVIAVFSEPGRKMMAHVTLVAFAAQKALLLNLGNIGASTNREKLGNPRTHGHAQTSLNA